MKYIAALLFVFLVYIPNYAKTDSLSNPDDLYRYAYQMEGQNNLFEAAEAYLKAAQLYHKSENYEYEAKVTERVGIIYQKAFHFKNSLTFFQKTLHLREAHFPKPDKIAQALYNIGIAHQHIGTYDSAVYYFDKALDTHTYNDFKAKCYFEIARVTRRLDDFDRTIRYYLNAGEMDLDSTMQAKVFANLGYSYLHFGDTAVAEHYIDKSLLIQQRVKAMINKGAIKKNQGEYETALTFFSIAALRMDTSRISEEVMFTYKQLAEIHSELGDKDNSSLCHQIRGDMGDRLFKQQKELSKLYNYYQGAAMVAKFEAEKVREAKESEVYRVIAIALGAILIGFIMAVFIVRRIRRKRKERHIKDLEAMASELN